MLTAEETFNRVLGASPDRMARWGGAMLLLTAAITAVMVYARVASDADQSTLLESLRSVAEHRGMYSLFSGARVVSGVTLTAGGWFLLRTWIIRDRWATSAVPYLFILSGICATVSGICAAVMAFQADPATVSTIDATGVGVVDNIRWLSGKAGFTAAGLALVVAAWFQWRVGGTLQRVAPASAVLGVVMQLIWLDAASIIHPVVGGLFFLWLVVIGAMLVTGRVERHFITRYGGDTETVDTEPASRG
jgi:hypothetical protein